ncbi:MAG: hypothetical protein Q9218_001208 [Villophora microphyllina]
MSIRPIFVASIGNPSPAYTNTYHSAGHTVLAHLRIWLHTSPFRKSRIHASGLISDDPRDNYWTLWQSPSLMNVSGKPVFTAWRAFLASLSTPEERSLARMVLVHDELELPIGKIKVREGVTSAKGHNGVKSVMAMLPKGMEMTKVGVGIGRPASRESRDVAAYVMKRMTQTEVDAMTDVAGQVSEVVRNMSSGAR